MTRKTKTPRQRAEEQLAVAERKVAKLTVAAERHESEARILRLELRDAERRRDYLAQNPDLPQTRTVTDPTEEQTA